MEDAPLPPPRPVLRCDHGEQANVKQSRYLSTTAHAYYCFLYTVVSIYFFSLIQLCIQLDCVIVIERSINFAEAGTV
jgi:hypothetical protein